MRCAPAAALLRPSSIAHMHTWSSGAAALGLPVITVFTTHWQEDAEPDQPDITLQSCHRQSWLQLRWTDGTESFLAEALHWCCRMAQMMTEEEEALLRGVDALEYMLTASIMPDDFDIEALAAFGPEAAAGCCPLPATGFLALRHWLSGTAPLAVWLPALHCSARPRPSGATADFAIHSICAVLCYPQHLPSLVPSLLRQLSLLRQPSLRRLFLLVELCVLQLCRERRLPGQNVGLCS